MNNCTCTLTNANIGVPNCQPIEDVAKKLILVQMEQDDGTANKIDVSGALDAAAVTALINNSDDSARWYPTPYIDNIEDVRADSVLETLNSGQNIKIKSGARSFMGVVVFQSPAFLQRLEAWGCVKFGAYIVDDSGNLIGDGSEAGYLKPIRIDERTWDPMLVKTTDSTSQKVQIKFEWHRTMKDSDLRMLTAADYTDADLLAVEGLIDISCTVSDISTTGFTATIFAQYYGSQLTKTPIEGIAEGDFEIYNETDAGSVTISTMTESAGGVYAFTFSAEDSSDELQLQVDKNGLDDTTLRTVTITIP